VTRGIRIAKGLTLPLEAVTQTFGLLAVRGGGKSNTAAVMAEGMYEAGLPFVVIDPEGSWWGLRSAADGKGPGLPIPIFGGDRGDVPLEETAGQMIAELIAKERLSCVLDVSEFSEGGKRRFLTDFAVNILKRNKDPLHLILEEADDYIPQKPMRESARLLRAWQNVVRRGRKKGLGVTMITQRSAVINKDVLTQIETLIVHRITSPQDRKAIEGWVVYHGQKQEILASLSGLKPGEAWVWSPWMEITDQFQIYRRKTFDSAATPTGAKRRRRPATLADIDLGAIKEQMAETIERVKETDPKELKRRIKDLERELHSQKQLTKAPTPAPEPQLVEVPMLTAEERALLVEVGERLVEVGGVVEASVNELRASNDGLGGLIGSVLNRQKAHVPPRPQYQPKPRREDAPQATISTPPRSEPAESDGGYRPRAGARRMLEVLARRYPLTTTRSQLRLMAKLRKSGTSETYYRELLGNGLIQEDSEGWVLITDSGLGILGLSSPLAPMTKEENIESFRGIFRAGARRMLDILIEIHPQGISREELFERAELTNSGTSNTYLRDLARNGAAEVNGNMVCMGEALFL